MSENRSFGGRRRRSKHFRPSGGMTPPTRKPDRAALEARAEVVGEKGENEAVFERSRYEKEIERAENIAAGLPPDSPPDPQRAGDPPPMTPSDFREPHLDTPAEV